MTPTDLHRLWRLREARKIDRLFLCYFATMLLALLAATYAWAAPLQRINVPRWVPGVPPPSVREMVMVAAGEAGVPPALAVALAESESGLDPAAEHVERNGISSRGVMQLNSRYWPEMSTADNIRAGVGYLAKQVARCAGLEYPASITLHFVNVVPDVQRCAIDFYRGKRR